MKRYLLLLFAMLYSLWALAQDTMYVQGKVHIGPDTNAGISNLLVFIVPESDTTLQLDTTYTDPFGSFLLKVANPNNYTGFYVKVVDKCDSILSQYVAPTVGTVNLDFSTPCPFMDNESMIKIEGRITDNRGLPLANWDVAYHVYSIDYPFDENLRTDMGGNFRFYHVYLPGIDTAIEIIVKDNCGNEYTEYFSLPNDTNVIVHEDADFEVECGLTGFVYVEGLITNSSGMPWPKAGVKAQYVNDRYKTIYVNSNEEGEYYIAMPGSIYPDDELVLTVKDSTGTEISYTVPVSVDTVYEQDFVVDTKPYRVILVNGILSNNSQPARGVAVSTYLSNSTDERTTKFSDADGYFTIPLMTPNYVFDNVFVMVEADCAGSSAGSQEYSEEDNYWINLDDVSCDNPNIDSNSIRIHVTVRDTNGHPVDGIPVKLGEVYGYYPEVVTTYNGEAYLTWRLPNDSMLLRVEVEDFAHIMQDTLILFDYTTTNYDLNFVVQHAEPVRVTVEGYIWGEDSIPISGALVKAYAQGVQDTLYTRADENGHYMFITEPLPDQTTAYITAIDSCNNSATISFTYNQGETHIVQDIYDPELTCPFNQINTMVTITGVVHDQNDQPAVNQIVGAYYLNAGFSEFYGMTNENGQYRIIMPMASSQDTIFVFLFDQCNNYYDRIILYQPYRQNYTADFVGDDAIECPPGEFTDLNSSLVIGIEQDWENYQHYQFYAYLLNMPNGVDPTYLVWHLGQDTVITSGPELDYTFDLSDTCITVWAELLFSQNYRMISPQYNICIQDPFQQLPTMCYADFISTLVDSSCMDFEFYPYLEATNNMTPVEVTWDFGDGTVVTLDDSFDSVMRHIYEQQGAYMVTLTATFSNGDSTCQAVWAEPVWAGDDVWYPDSCAAAFYVEEDPDNSLTLNFQDISYPGENSIVAYYYWDFGDSASSTVSSPVHTYDTAGDYDVTLSILTTSGCFDQFTMQVTAGADLEPILFYPDTVGGSKPAYGVKFHNTSKTDKDTWKWDFGDEVKGGWTEKLTDSVIIHYYPDTGYYNVTLLDSTTGAGFTMRIHVTQDNQVIPIYGILIPAGTLPTQVNDLPKAKPLSVYPNPATDNVFINLGQNAKSAVAEIYNLNGKLVRKVLVVNSNVINLKLNGLAHGTYLVKVIYDGKMGIAKIVKQ